MAAITPHGELIGLPLKTLRPHHKIRHESDHGFLTEGQARGRMAQDSKLNRRMLLGGLGAGTAALLTPSMVRAQTTDLRGFDALWHSAEDEIRSFFGHVTYETDGIELDLPQQADVGSSVPVSIRIHAGMTERDYPRVVHLMAHENPSTHVLSAWFKPGAGRAEFSTRIRLEKSQ